MKPWSRESVSQNDWTAVKFDKLFDNNTAKIIIELYIVGRNMQVVPLAVPVVRFWLFFVDFIKPLRNAMGSSMSICWMGLLL